MLHSQKSRVFAILIALGALVASSIQAIPAAQATGFTCAQGGVCVVGETGPGGGIVFYVEPDAGTFACGPTLSENCTYLENGRGTGSSGIALWSKLDFQSTTVGLDAEGNPVGDLADLSAIGTGYKNTLAIIAQQGDYEAVTNKFMAGAAHAFLGGGKTDWYLPSTDELYALHLSRLGTIGFTQSSTETSSATISGIYYPNPGASILSGVGKSETTNYFTTVRAFSQLGPVRNCPTAGTYTLTGTVITGSDNCRGDLIIPNGVTSIGDEAFHYMTYLTSVSIPSSVESIGQEAFWATERLTSVLLSEGLKHIGNSAFLGSDALASINIPASVETIGTDCFYTGGENHSSLSTVTFSPNSNITTIPERAFFNTSVTTINLPNSIITIDLEAFAASALESITVPKSVRSINESAFRDTELRSINFEANSELEFIGKNAFGSDNQLTSISLPENLQTIDQQAFRGTGITALTIPASVTTIGIEPFPTYPSTIPIQIDLSKDLTYSLSFLDCRSSVPCDGGDNPNSGYSVSGLLPAGMSLNTTTGVISGKPTASGTFKPTFTITYGSGAGTGTNANFTFVVAGAEDGNNGGNNSNDGAAAAAQKQRELTEVLSLIPSIAGLALNLGDLTNSLLVKQKCVKGKKTKTVRYGAKCPKGYKKKK